MPAIDTATLTPQEAAEFLRRAPVTLERWRRLRLGPPFFRINGRILYDQNDIESWIAEQKQTTMAERREGASPSAMKTT